MSSSPSSLLAIISSSSIIKGRFCVYISQSWSHNGSSSSIIIIYNLSSPLVFRSSAHVFLSLPTGIYFPFKVFNMLHQQYPSIPSSAICCSHYLNDAHNSVPRLQSCSAFSQRSIMFQPHNSLAISFTNSALNTIKRLCFSQMKCTVHLSYAEKALIMSRSIYMYLFCHLLLL